VYDKTVRRRRAVLALLVVLSLILLSAYFGESPDGGLHSVQNGFLTVVSPLQDGANKALKPVRNLFGWFGDTLHAKSQRNELLKQRDKLRKEVIADRADEHGYHELLGLYHLDQLNVNSYRPVTATVVGKSPNLWYSTVVIDKGTSSGIRKNDPVVNAEGLVGKVAQAASDGAVIDLITDSEVGVSARINGTNATGVVQPKVGDPNDLVLQYLPANTSASRGEYVVTSGTVSSPDDSLYPPGIPIGQVSSLDEESAYKSVNVHPLADLHNLDVVQVLTYAPGSKPARLGSLDAGLPSSGRTGAGTGLSEGGQLASTSAGTGEATGEGGGE
jgi:rod shape-determining protein MreC